jgi:hypothetical protein
MMSVVRQSIPDFQFANDVYIGAIVSFYTVDAFGAKTATLATLYDAQTGVGTLLNPQTMDSDGKFQQPAYVDVSVIGSVTIANGVADHDTGIFAIPTVDATSLAFLQGLSGAVVRSVQSKESDLLSLKDFGATCDGATDDTTATQAAITAIGTSAKTLLIPGPTKITGALTFGPNLELWFMAGAYFVGTGAQVLQVQSQIVAGPHQCFSACAPIATNGMTVLPEWFGAKGDASTDDKAAIQLAIDFMKNTGGVVQFDARTYNMSANVNIGTASAGSVGQNTILQGKGRNSTKIRTTGANASGLQILGAAGTPLQGIAVRDLTIGKSVAGTGGYGLYAQYTSLLQIENVTVSEYFIGVGLLRATNTLAEKVLAGYSGVSNNWRGFELNGSGTGAGGNASSVFRDCYADGTGATGTGSIGFYAFGSYVSDLVFDACETQSANIGMTLDCTASAVNGNEDVQIINLRTDQFSTYGLYVTGAGSAGSNDSMISVIGGWHNPKNTGAETDGIYLLNSRGVAITAGTQLYADANWANAYGVKMSGCNNITIDKSVMFRDQKYGVHMTSCGYSQIAGNFYNQSGRGATAYIYAVGGARIMANGGLFDGYATQAIIFDATSSGCGIVGNTANITNITTRFTNSGGGPIGAADGSTGLNSGV